MNSGAVLASVAAPPTIASRWPGTPKRSGEGVLTAATGPAPTSEPLRVVLLVQVKNLALQGLHDQCRESFGQWSANANAAVFINNNFRRQT